MSQPNDYEVFLQTWKPGEMLQHVTLPQYLSDRMALDRILNDGTGEASLTRTPFVPGPKVMAENELVLRALHFFENHQKEWAKEFKDFVLSRGIPVKKLNTFIASFAKSWVDGRVRRQDSPEMLSIKASIRDFDKFCNSANSRLYVINSVDANIDPLFTPTEMATIFQANYGLLEAYMPDYVDHLDGEGPDSLNELYVRRGVYMPQIDKFRRELHYLSSYSITLGPVEQFAQTWTPETRDRGVPSIFSAPLAAVQDRVVAFAPFIEGMNLSQIELVIAPPVEKVFLRHDGEHGGIHEFSFL
ncbi:MAG: hypothetical protein ABJM26_04825 [Anderseniella sp.]